MSRTGWSVQQLSEFAALLAPLGDERTLLRVAAERAAEAFDAELCVLANHTDVLAAVGCAIGDGAVDRLVTAIGVGRSTVDIDGLGPCSTMSAPLEDEGAVWHLVVARVGDEPFEAEDAALLRGMGRLVELSLRNVRLVESLRERHHLLERLSYIQRSISSRVALGQVLDVILQSACELLEADHVVLWELDRAAPDRLRVWHVVGATEHAPLVGSERDRSGFVAGRCIDENTLVSDVAHGDDGAPTRQVLATPVSENGEPVGALMVVGPPQRRYRVPEHEVLLALAEHASLAVNDARTVDAMYEAYHDHVTGLPNRALFFDRVDEAVASGELEGRPVAVLFIDLDGFKQVNDTLGHEAGDHLLREVGSRIRAAIRSDDVVARLGGDEFAVLLVSGATPSVTDMVAQRLLEELRRPMVLAGTMVGVRASIGVALGTGGKDDVNDLVRDADIAMYRAKMLGKDRHVVFEQGMRGHVAARLELEQDLRRAVQNGDLTLVYQPIVRLSDGRACGVEALARWDHPRRGPIPPQQFIALAADMGLADVIDRWVLRQSCRELHERLQSGRVPAPFDMSVNVSQRRLRNDTIVDDVEDAIDATGIDPSMLIVEITEGAIAEDPEGSARRLWRLHELGVRIALDDFGAGASSLGRLPLLPVDLVKIDGRFIAALGHPGRHGSVTTAIVEVARAFGMATVAEGVETDAQRRALQALGCAYAQGYLFAEPTAGEWVTVEVSLNQRRSFGDDAPTVVEGAAR
jgi:diguanylate cyclase (GGDEF)-like protein